MGKLEVRLEPSYGFDNDWFYYEDGDKVALGYYLQQLTKRIDLLETNHANTVQPSDAPSDPKTVIDKETK